MAVVWMVSTRPPTSKPFETFNIHSVTGPNWPIIIGTTDTFMFHSLFNSLARWWYLSYFSHSFSFILWSAVTAKFNILQVLFFVDYYKVWFLDGIRWSVCMLKSHMSLCVSFPRVKCKFIAHFPVDHLAHLVVSSLVLFLG